MAAESTSCPCYPRTTQGDAWAGSDGTETPIQNNKPNRMRRQPQCLLILTAGKLPTDLENPRIQSKIIRIVDLLWHCGRAKELDKFLQTVWSNFASQKHPFLVWATVPGYLTVVWVATGNAGPDRFSNHQWTEQPDVERFHTRTAPKTALLWPGSTYSRASFSQTQNFGSNWVFEFWSYHNMIYMWKMQCCMFLHLPFSNVRSDQFSLGHCDITPRIGCFLLWLKQYRSDHTLENGRCMRMQTCIFHIHIILWYDQNSNT